MVYSLGYANGLDIQGSYAAGKALYSGSSFSLDTKLMCRAVGSISSVTGSSISCTNIINYPNVTNTTFETAPSSFSTNEFIHGFVRILSGSKRNKVYKISNNSGSTLNCTIDVQADGLTNGYFDVVSGSCTFNFPRNPSKRTFRKRLAGSMLRMAFYQDSIVIPTGWEGDDSTIMCYLSEKKDADRLEVLLNHVLDYMGFDCLYSTGISGDNYVGNAPLILSNGEGEQFLFFFNDYNFIRDSKRGNMIWEFMIHGQNYL